MGVETQIRISAKNLGELALPGFCPRCFWIKFRLANKLPFQIFPGIFSSIDGYTKNFIHAYFDRNRRPPSWLNSLGDIVRYVEPPHWSKFSYVDPESNVLLLGTPDGVFVRSDNSHIIVDYKTAKYTGTQDSLFSMYEVQLNAYAVIGERRGLNPVTGLALIYMEPLTDSAALEETGNHRSNGFAMGFAANIHPVKLDAARIPILLARARDIYEQPHPPHNCGCKDCVALENLLAIVSTQTKLF